MNAFTKFNKYLVNEKYCENILKNRKFEKYEIDKFEKNARVVICCKFSLLYPVNFKQFK